MINGIKIEVCCGSVEDVCTAISQPIDRIELNSALELGGLTPTLSTLRKVKQLTDLPICCMSRVRGGGFNYTENEIDTIFSDARILLENGADGIVFGFLNEDKTINQPLVKEMVQLIHSFNKEAVFHKAFDETEMSSSIKQLIELKVDRILTSGGKNYPDITKGIPVLKEINDLYMNEIQILPGGGIRANNVHQVLTQTGIKQVHMSASKQKADGTNSDLFTYVDKDKLKEILDNI